MTENQQQLAALIAYVCVAWIVFFCLRLFRDHDEPFFDFVMAVFFPLLFAVLPIFWFFDLAYRLAENIKNNRNKKEFEKAVKKY